MSKIGSFISSIKTFLYSTNGELSDHIRIRGTDEITTSFANLEKHDGYKNLLLVLDIIGDMAVTNLRLGDVSDTESMAYSQAYSSIRDFVEGIVQDLSIPEEIVKRLEQNLGHQTNDDILL